MRILRFYQHINEELSKNDPIPELDMSSKLGVILLGAPGSGKSTFIRDEMMRKMSNFKSFSSDDVSLMFTKDPNVRKRGASRLNIDRLKRFMLSGQNFIYDTTGSSDGNLRSIIDHSKELGYDILFIHIIVSLDTAKKHNLERKTKGGHFVDVDYLEKNYREQFSKMKEYESEFDPLSYYVVLNKIDSYKYYKMDSGKLLKRRVDRYVPIH